MGNKRLRIIVADRNTIVSSCMEGLLDKVAEFDVIAETRMGAETLRAVKKFRPDILFINHSPRR